MTSFRRLSVFGRGSTPIGAQREGEGKGNTSQTLQYNSFYSGGGGFLFGNYPTYLTNDPPVIISPVDEGDKKWLAKPTAKASLWSR